MKSLRISAIMLIIMGFGFNTINAQALVTKDFTWYLQTDDGIYPAVETMGVFTPSGNILHKQIFMIDKEDSLVPDKGVNKVAFKTWVYYKGITWIMVDAEGIVYPGGKCTIIFHTNGAGDETPPNKR